jgi:hypothetical protein
VVEEIGDRMKKLLPVLVLIGFLVVSLFNFSLLGLNDESNTTSTDDNPNLPAALPTVQVEHDNSEIDHTGSRFMVTASTSIILESPKNFENFSYGDLIVVRGRLFEDNNTNNIFDTEDIPVPFGKVNIEFGDEYITRETEEDGYFEWQVTNDISVKGIRDMKITYDGQYTINGSEWYDVDTDPVNGNGRLLFNEDDDYYIDVGYDNISGNWVYNFSTGDGKFTPGKVDISQSKRIGGDIIIRDIGPNRFKGTWDTGDRVVRDPLAEGDFPSDDYLQKYYDNPGSPGRVDFTGPLVDEETPNTPDQVTFYQVWADDDGDWDVNSHDNGEDGQPGTSDPGEGDLWPTPGVPGDPTKPGEDYVDEDINFTKFRKESNLTIWLALWHNTELDAVILNSTGKQTKRALVGEEITIKGTLKNVVNPSLRPAKKALKIKIFGTFMPGIKYTNSKGEFEYKYTIPEHPSIRVGQRDIDIIFNDKLYDDFYNLSNASHEYLVPTSLSTQPDGPITLRIYRPIHIELEKANYIGYRFKSFAINGTLLDDNDRPLFTSILNDDGSSETITTNAYKIIFEWGRPIDRYYNYREEELLDASGNFSIAKIQINHPDQAMGDIPVTITIEANESQTFYLTTSQSIDVEVRSKASIELWIDQDKDGFVNEDLNSKKGQLADYITRTEFIDNDGNTWNFNKIDVYGRLFYSQRPEDGINGKNIKYYWEDTEVDYTDKNYYSKTLQKDFNLNGRIEDNEEGRFIMPDPNILEHFPKIIEKNHELGPIALNVKYDDPGDYIDPIEIRKEFYVVAMTKITINIGSGIKGENITITGRLEDDLKNGVPYQDVTLYWEDLQGELLKDDKFDPVKLADAKIGNVTTDNDGYFSFYSEKVLKDDVDVGKGYIVAIFEGSEPPYDKDNAYIGANSKEVPFEVSSHTIVELEDSSKNQQLIRGRSFRINGTVFEKFKQDKNLKTKVILGIEDSDQMELYIKNYGDEEDIQITDIRVEYKSEGKFQISGTVPYDLEVGIAELRLVFKGSKNGNYLGDEEISFHEIWVETVIRILAPDIREKEIEEEGYVLKEDIKQDLYDSSSEDFNEPGLRFYIQVVEKSEGGVAKPVEAGGRVTLTITSTFSVFTNKSIDYTDEFGKVNFTFNKPLKDTDWGYTLAQSDPEELMITLEYGGTDFYLRSKSLPIQTTHWPPEEKEGKGFYEEYGWLIWTIVAIVIAFLIVFFFAMRWYTKQQRIRGMRRIIKRAADQLIAGNEYQAVIFKSYQKLGVHLRKYGYLRRESETFREFEDAVRSALPIDRMSMDKFLILLEEARYSSHQIGEGQRNDAILNLRAIERSLDRIIIDEDAALRALERLEEEGVKETKIVLGGKPASPQNVPQLLKGAAPKKENVPPKPPGGNVN